MSGNNNKQDLFSYFYKHVAFIFIKEFAHSAVVHTFFD